MAITVRDALKIGGLVEARVIAGKAGLDNVIRAVDIIDVPDAAIWFRRDSLLSTTFYALKDNLDAQLQMLDDIKRCGGAALIIFSPERYISHIDECLIKKADDLSLPLLQMPDCSYIDVIVPVMSQILDKQVRELEYAQEVHSMMTDIILKGKGTRELLNSLTILLQKPVVMADSDLTLLDAAAPPAYPATFPPLLRYWQDSSSRIPLETVYPESLLNEVLYKKKPSYYQHGSGENDYLEYFFPVVAGNSFHGVMIVPSLERELTGAETVAVEAGAMAIALDILKQKSIRESRQKSELDFYNELFLGNIKNRETIISRARQFGLKTDGSYFALLVELNRESLYYSKNKEAYPRPAKEELEKKLFRLLNYALETEHAEGIVVETLGSHIMLIPIPDTYGEERAQEFIKKMLAAVKNSVSPKMAPIPLFMSAGGYCSDIGQISQSYLQAWETIDLAKKMSYREFALTHSDMMPYHLVKRFLTSNGASQLFAQAYAPLLSHDQDKGGDLVPTLEAYLENNFSRSRTAAVLHIHRNTLNYRLHKIEELLGQDVDKIDAFPFLMASISRRLSS